MDSPSSSSHFHNPISCSTSTSPTPASIFCGHRPGTAMRGRTSTTTQFRPSSNSFSRGTFAFAFSSMPSILLVALSLLSSLQNGLCLVSFFSADDLKYTFGVDHLRSVPPHRLVSPRLIPRQRPVRPDEPMFDLYLQLFANERPLLLSLYSVTDQLLADRFTVVRRTRPDGGGFLQTERAPRAMAEDCHFHHRSEHILAAISNCDEWELKGTIIHNGSVHVLHPIPAHHMARVRRSTGDRTKALHVLYRREAKSAEDFCGIENTISSEELVENEAGVHEDAFVAGQKLMREGDLLVELAVFVDEQLWRHFSSKYGSLAWQKLQQYMLTMLSNIQIMYRQPTAVPSLTFRVVRYEVYQTQPSAIAAYLHENGNAQRYLDMFCRYQRNLGARDWDHALMLTGFDIHRGYGATSISGIARLDGMCDSWNSCTLAEGLDFTSAFIGTHELGHAVGMRHDEPYCSGTFIMSASLGPGKVTWSSCSMRDYQSFIQRLDARQNNCMRTSLLREQLPLTESLKPGQIYDAHEQCRLMHGPSYVQVSPRQDHYDGICHMIWCGQSNYGRIITSHPALEGTHCGANQWCSLGRCVPWNVGFVTPLAPRPSLQAAAVGTLAAFPTTTPSQIDGQWSAWSPFECRQCSCSDISGAIGVTLSQRNCSNPAPLNGGVECSGPAHRAAVCARKCPQGSQSVDQFISAKCSEHKRTRQDSELTGTGSQLSRFPQRACKVFCDVKNPFGAQRNYRFYGDNLSDGAPCGVDRYCLNGECTELSCEDSMLIFGEDMEDYCPSSQQKCSAAQPDPEEVAKGHWEEWSFWSPCTASCGHTGIQLRSRTCSGANQCEGEPSSESQPCNRRILCPTTSSDDAQWSEWTPWTQCSVSCGRGSQARYRRCTTPQNAVAFTCSGQTMDLRNCEELPCVEITEQRRHYGHWTEWSAWSTCSSSCGPGSTVRMRACSQEPCEGASQQKLDCNLKECATWSQWATWSDCSLLCGKGMRSRSRRCPAGSTCPGTGVEQQPCNEQPCDQSADSQTGLMWSDWSAWGPCSVSCGNGVRRRTRACHRENCAGSHFESAICNEAECAVSDALWGGWGYWSPCSESCGFGVRRRVRKCYGSGDLHKCPWTT
uniref:Peptidase M12B domain-containing protein n=1 Tax=Globodera rostochiensis TaxID=31243 RepID=A0A914HD48_GLORO